VAKKDFLIFGIIIALKLQKNSIHESVSYKLHVDKPIRFHLHISFILQSKIQQPNVDYFEDYNINCTSNN
jgi:hypothetical protein